MPSAPVRLSPAHSATRSVPPAIFPCKSGRLWGVFAMLVGVFSCSLVGATPVLMNVDLQMVGAVGQITQSGWQAAEIGPNPVSGNQSLPLTVSGSGAGITAMLATTGNWEGRGGSTERRGVVSGTSFDGIVSDLWFTRVMNFSLQLGGLDTGKTYAVRAWHNDPYLDNQGASAGGGSVRASLSGATLVSRTDGTVTNLYGTQNDAAFGITQITFAPTSSSVSVTFTRTGGSFTGVPVSGMELTLVSVPEPSTYAMAITGVVFGMMAWQRHRARRSER